PRRPASSTLLPSTPLFRSSRRPGARPGPVTRRCSPASPDCQEIVMSADATRLSGISSMATRQVLGALARDAVAAVGIELALESRSEEHTSELQSRENLVCR